jgi:hypothetical protein
MIGLRLQDVHPDRASFMRREETDSGLKKATCEEEVTPVGVVWLSNMRPLESGQAEH